MSESDTQNVPDHIRLDPWWQDFRGHLNDLEADLEALRGKLRQAVGCDHDGAYDLVTTHTGADDVCETPWSWCPKCGSLWSSGVQRDPQYIRDLEGSAEA